MKRLFPFAILTVMTFTVPGTAEALDAACEPILKSMEAQSSAPAWQVVSVMSASKFKLEAMKVNGKFYTRYNEEKWKNSPISADEASLKMIADIRNNIIKVTECKVEPDQMIDGVNAGVLSYTIEMSGAPAAKSKLFFNKSDGRPVAQLGDQVESHYSFKDLPAPK